MKRGLYEIEDDDAIHAGSVATARQAALANLFEEPSIKFSKVYSSRILFDSESDFVRNSFIVCSLSDASAFCSAVGLGISSSLTLLKSFVSVEIISISTSKTIFR